MKRMVSIFFPRLAMDNWRKRAVEAPADDASVNDRPFALVAEGPHGFLLSALNPPARDARLRPGQRLTDARTICPELQVEPADPAGDAAALKRLALWARRWSPWTAVDGADGLFVDITGCTHLFSGEQAMLRDMASGFRNLGHAARIAATPTAGASWALARHARGPIVIANPETLTAKLGPLSVRGLRLESDAVLLLERLGLKTIGALGAVPRLALARRFVTEAVAANPLIRLDQALGRIDEPIAPVHLAPPVRVVRRVTDPITHVPILAHLLGEMATALCDTLERRGLGLRRIRFDGFRVDGGLQSIAAETAAPVREPAHLVRLFDGKLDTLDAGFGFDAVVLTAARHEPLDEAQAHLLERESCDAVLAHLIDRLSAKLGPASVRRPVAVQSHIPERSLAWRPALSGAPAKAEAQDRGHAAGPPPSPGNKAVLAPPPRPIRLLDRPEPISVLYATPEGAPRRFVWRKLSHLVAKSEGPERIAPEWWRERSTVRLRDYYRVEDEAGCRYWLFREGAEGDGRGGSPGWFLHGLFA